MTLRAIVIATSLLLGQAPAFAQESVPRAPRKMNLTEAQAHALLEIGGAEEFHGYISPRVLNYLMTCDYIYYNNEGAVEFTPAGKEVYDELAAQMEKGASPSA